MDNSEYFVLAAVLICVWLHVWVLLALAGGRDRHLRSQNRIVVVMLVWRFTHILDILVFAVAYALMLQQSEFGDILFSGSIVYTTLGFGDLIPIGLIRIITGGEPLVGFSLVAWSISSAFVEIHEATRARANNDSP